MAKARVPAVPFFGRLALPSFERLGFP
jgi:hypothetical protein